MLEFLNIHQVDQEKTAIISDDKSYSYKLIKQHSKQFASVLLDIKNDLQETRIAFMVTPGFEYVTTQWAIWLAGGVAVPLCISHPLASLQYVIEDTAAQILVVSPAYELLLKELAFEKNIRLIVLGNLREQAPKPLPIIDPSRRAMILYTSGTTALPKGVVSTHANIAAQVASLLEAWQYSDQDQHLCILPLHHVHGIINVLTSTFASGGTVTFLPQFTAQGVFEWFKKINASQQQGVFMAVPTIYFKLITHFESLPEAEQKNLRNAMRSFRLMVSGSAALPVSVMEKWENISGHRLLERYGMTEIGMAISNPYAADRRAGHIGQALPGVEVRLVDENNQSIALGEPGEIQIKGPNVFKEYWQKSQATTDTFTPDGWFKTGDVAVLENDYYKILGRSSVDIIKSGGYKISALEIEEILRTYPEITDCSVLGIENEEWGELVVAVLTLENADIDLQKLTTWLKIQMPAYRIPRQFKILDELPRNAMGKVTKNELKPLFTKLS